MRRPPARFVAVGPGDLERLIIDDAVLAQVAAGMPGGEADNDDPWPPPP